VKKGLSIYKGGGDYYPNQVISCRQLVPTGRGRKKKGGLRVPRDKHLQIFFKAEARNEEL